MTRRQLEQAALEAAAKVTGAVTEARYSDLYYVPRHRIDDLAQALAELDKLREPTKPRAARCAPVTSHTAARFIASPAPSLQGRIVKALWWAGDCGLTVAELELQLVRKHETVSARVNELANAGWITDSGETRKTKTGTRAIVWKLTSAAYGAVVDHLQVTRRAQ